MKNVVKGFNNADRGQMIMACGTGKTLIALFIREKLAAQRTLVLVPSLSLLKQTLQEWTANAKVDFDFLPVCSDESVNKDEDAMPCRTPVIWDSRSPPIPRRSLHSCVGGLAREWCSPPTNPRRRLPRRSSWVGCPLSIWRLPTRLIAAQGLCPLSSPPSWTTRRSRRGGGCS